MKGSSHLISCANLMYHSCAKSISNSIPIIWIPKTIMGRREKIWVLKTCPNLPIFCSIPKTEYPYPFLFISFIYFATSCSSSPNPIPVVTPNWTQIGPNEAGFAAPPPLHGRSRRPEAAARSGRARESSRGSGKGAAGQRPAAPQALAAGG